MTKRTAVYVDGFNLYHSALEGQPHLKWLDLRALAQALLNKNNEIVLIRYFTARVSGTSSDPGLPTRQDTYLRALQAHIPNLSIQFGQFKVEKKIRRLVNPPRQGNPYVEVWQREEKGSDVNLAVHLLDDAWANRFECALIISNDSDLAEALHLVRSQGKPVGIASVASRPTRDLRQNSDFFRRIKPTHLRNSQLPDPVLVSRDRRIYRPARWN